jgi:hypothetical protein
MPPTDALRFEISMTETEPFVRLVEFVGEVVEHAIRGDDPALWDICRRLNDDLLEIHP